MLIPILASVSHRQLPSASVAFHLLIYRWDADNNVCGMGGGRKPKFPSRYLPKIGVSSAAYPNNVSIRQLPSDSVGFRGLWTTISSYIVGVQTTMYVGGGRKPKFLADIYLKLKSPALFIPILVAVSFLHRPSASVGFRGLPSHHISLGMQTTM